jgi:hypothetical protein
MRVEAGTQAERLQNLDMSTRRVNHAALAALGAMCQRSTVRPYSGTAYGKNVPSSAAVQYMMSQRLRPDGLGVFMNIEGK